MTPAGVIPSLLPDETIYSWCGYLHQLWQLKSSARTSVALFGVSHAMRQHEMFEHLAWMLSRLGLIGRLEEVLRGHTVALAYWPFLPPERRYAILQAATNDDRYWTRDLLGVSRSWPVCHPLRLCPECVNDDQAVHGRAYWHVQHQLPATAVCLVHAAPLRSVSGATKRWIGPAEYRESASKLMISTTEAVRVAELASCLKRIHSVDIDGIRAACLQRLRLSGVIQSLFRTRHQHLRGWFRASETAGLCATPGLGISSLQEGDWIASLLWRHHRSHPANWLLLWSALNWDDARSAVVAFEDAVLSRPVVRKQLELWPLGTAGKQAPVEVYEATDRASTYAEAMEILRCSRGRLVRWLEEDEELRRRWRERLHRERKDDIVMGATQPGRSTATSSGMRWLAKHDPSTYRSLGFAGSHQRVLC